MRLVTAVKETSGSLCERKYVRYKEGALLYGVSERSFMRMAKKAGATSTVGRISLVNLKLLDEFLESCRTS